MVVSKAEFEMAMFIAFHMGQKSMDESNKQEGQSAVDELQKFIDNVWEA